MKPGDVVIAAFPGAHLTKTRPAVVLSTFEYHKERPDVILGLITSKPADILCSTDYEIQDWQLAGLHSPSHFRLYLVTLRPNRRTFQEISWRGVQMTFWDR